MWISKHKYQDLLDRVEILERQLDGDGYAQIHHYEWVNDRGYRIPIYIGRYRISIKKALQLVINHLGLCYEPEQTIPETITKCPKK